MNSWTLPRTHPSRKSNSTLDFPARLVVSFSMAVCSGGEVKDLVILFMEESALKKFRKSQGWEAGVDGNIAVIKTGGGASLDTTTIKEPIIGFVVGVKGLLVDASFKGSKFSPIKR